MPDATDFAWPPKGFMFPCGLCERLLEGRERGLKTDDGKVRCSAPEHGLACGGPLSGMAFPAYKGPLTRDTMRQRCVFCGTTETVAFVRVGLDRFGVCSEHVSLLGSVTKGRAAPRKVDRDGEEARVK